ncbi:MAG TPA: galactokinase family protein [Acidimicrobiales bacterium]|nr:galactokinase family protein [Acidimicrobiales bacterium]
MIRAYAPGRVNLIGDHTDHQGGLVLPMAVDRGTTVTGRRASGHVRLRSADEEGLVEVGLEAGLPLAPGPEWGRYVAAIVELGRPTRGFAGNVSTTLPIGAGLSSSAALEVSVALALGFDGSSLELAQLCQRSEHLAVGVPCGIMDQLVSAAGVADHALLVDCHDTTIDLVPIPEDIDVLVVDSGERRSLAGTAYQERLAECARAADEVGPLRLLPAVGDVTDPVARRRARHVVTEIVRVRAFADALLAGDAHGAGQLMVESHASMSSDFEVSTPRLDALVRDLRAAPGIHGARLTGAGFGGSVVALAARGAALPDRAVRVRASSGASVTTEIDE